MRGNPTLAARGLVVAAAALAAFAGSAGCRTIGALGVLTAPRQIQKHEYELTNGRLAVLIETARPESDSPVFNEALQQRFSEILRDKGFQTRIIPREELLRLRQGNADFSRWTLQKIGREVNAQEVLYLRIDELHVREGPDSPMISPKVNLRVKIIAPELPPEQARLWPPDRLGRAIECSRQQEEYAGPASVDTAASKLGKDTAWLVARLFFDWDLEETTPRER